MEQYVTRTVTFVPHGRSVPESGTQDMIEVQFTPKGSRSWRRWYRCQICDRTYPEDRVVLIGGAAYCIRFKHYLEAKHHDVKDLEE